MLPLGLPEETRFQDAGGPQFRSGLDLLWFASLRIKKADFLISLGFQKLTPFTYMAVLAVYPLRCSSES